MENKINIAELLKNCPKGMELDCVMFNNVTLWEVEEGAQFPISIKVGIDDMYLLTECGEWNNGDINAKCVIFPKGKDTWEGFVPPCEFKEKLIVPKFKVGDRIKTKTSSYHYFVAEIRDNCYLAIYNHEEYPYLIPFANEKYYELVPNKFDISTLKPYKSEVLHRNTLAGYWKPAFWGTYIPENSVEQGSYKFLTTYGFVRYCIPFEGNEHLIGTTDDCVEYYKTWEE